MIILPEGNSGIRVWLWREGLMGPTRMDLEIPNLIKSIKMIIQMQVYNIRPPGIHIYIQVPGYTFEIIEWWSDGHRNFKLNLL